VGDLVRYLHRAEYNDQSPIEVVRTCLSSWPKPILQNFINRHRFPKFTTADWLPWEVEGVEGLRFLVTWALAEGYVLDTPSCAPACVEAKRTEGQRSTLGAPSGQGSTYWHVYELEIWSWFLHFLNWNCGRWDFRARRHAGGQGVAYKYVYHAISFG